MATKLFLVPEMVFGSLEIVSEAEPERRMYYCSKRGKHVPHVQRRFNCICVCGTRKVVRLNNLMDGNTTSCGCYGREMMQEGRDQWKSQFASEEDFKKYMSKKIKEGQAKRKQRLDNANGTVVE